MKKKGKKKLEQLKSLRLKPGPPIFALDELRYHLDAACIIIDGIYAEAMRNHTPRYPSPIIHS